MPELQEKSAGIGAGLLQAAGWMSATHAGSDVWFSGVSTDSRTLKPGALFFALRGPNFDGHDHLADAQAAGAAAAVVEHGTDVTLLPQVQVADTRQALGDLASAWRRHCGTPLVAVTGSNGKTTVKEMCRSILARRGSVLATEGNLNNEIGVPLTLLRLTRQHRHAVVEMGASSAGEIRYLAGMARPDVALITNAGPAHLAGFGSVEGVARAKAEIFSGLAAQGMAIINADDPHAELWQELAGGHQQLLFGLDNNAPVSARWQATAAGSRVELHTPAGDVTVQLPLPGRHNVMNLLAAVSVALTLDIDLETIRAGLEGMQGVTGRMSGLLAAGGARLIDDSYNANPLSLQAAIDVLADQPARRILVIGDMGELGEEAAHLHFEAGQYARKKGIDALYSLGSLSRECSAGFGIGAQHFSELPGLLEALAAVLDSHTTVLVKGSRSAHMERVVAALQQGGASGCCFI